MCTVFELIELTRLIFYKFFLHARNRKNLILFYIVNCTYINMYEMNHCYESLGMINENFCFINHQHAV